MRLLSLGFYFVRVRKSKWKPFETVPLTRHVASRKMGQWSGNRNPISCSCLWNNKRTVRIVKACYKSCSVLDWTQCPFLWDKPAVAYCGAETVFRPSAPGGLVLWTNARCVKSYRIVNFVEFCSFIITNETFISSSDFHWNWWPFDQVNEFKLKDCQTDDNYIRELFWPPIQSCWEKWIVVQKKLPCYAPVGIYYHFGEKTITL